MQAYLYTLAIIPGIAEIAGYPKVASPEQQQLIAQYVIAICMHTVTSMAGQTGKLLLTERTCTCRHARS